ncbi:MAG TPA: flagellar biosynthesis protein FlgL [Pseudolabrys sp.]|jgi:flagellin-like hook-associated protein FlgL
MTISGVSSNIAPLIQSALDINKQLDDLQRQLSSGQKSDTYAGLGSQSGIAVSLNAQLSAINSFNDTITNVGTTISLQQVVLQQIASIGGNVQSATTQANFAIDGTGQTTGQKTAQNQLDQILSLLNSQGANGYLFSGSAPNQQSVDTTDHILNGNGAQAGLKQVIAERNQADLGADGLGRLVIPAAVGATLSVSEDAAGSPFGLKLAGVSSTLSGATVTGPSGSPAAISVNLGATNPSNGDSITFTFSLPDGTSQTLRLQATTSAPPGANQFTIGGTPAATAANLQAALTAGVSQIGSTSLSAASAMAASNDFFGDPPQRVSGSPATATALVDGTSANTVIWYTGEDGSGSARSTSTARIDPSTTISYGTRANEQGIRWIVQSIAALAATTYSPSDANAPASYAALNQRVYTALGVPLGVQNITDIGSSLATAQTAMASTKSQHQQTANMLTTMQQSIEGVDTTQVGAQILSLQTSLSASLSTTARLASLNLLNYLSPVTG